MIGIASLHFHESPKLSQTLNVLIRVSYIDAENKIKSRVYSIDKIDNKTTVKELKQHAMRFSKLTGLNCYHRRLYYYGFELHDDDMHIQNSEFFTRCVDQTKLPLIFDFVLTHVRETEQLPHSTIISDMRAVVNQELNTVPTNIWNGVKSVRHSSRTENYDNDNMDDASNYARFFRNFALIYYIRLRMHFAVKNK